MIDREERSAPRGRVSLDFAQMVLIVLGAMLLGSTVPGRVIQTKKIPEDVETTTKTKQIAANQTFDDVREGPWPRLAWLMSFPNSGTSYTMSLVSRASGHLVGTNYGAESAIDHNGTSIPVLMSNLEEIVDPKQTGGPFWADIGVYKHRTPPSTYIMTKTHCGGRCETCGPSHYVESPHSFLIQCKTGSKVNRNQHGHRQKHRYDYDANRVYKAIHLIRNPFDNVVSRFHLQNKHMIRDNQTVAVQVRVGYEQSKEGFRSFCADLTTYYEKETKGSRFVDQSVLQMVTSVPCYLDFFRYIQWHNLAFTTTDELLNIPTHLLYYEDYERRFDETVSELLDFLHLPNNGNATVFQRGKTYVDYFTAHERELLRNGSQILSSKKTWDSIQRYFE